MAFFHSPKIPTNNLRVCVDGLNKKSYAGSGNTWVNMISNLPWTNIIQVNRFI